MTCLTRVAIPQGKWLLCTVYTKPRWWACVWVCLFFRPYPALPCLPRPGLRWLSFSSSLLSGQTSSWPFCRHGRSGLLLKQTAVNPLHKTIWQLPNTFDAGDGLCSLLSYNVEKLFKFHDAKRLHFIYSWQHGQTFLQEITLSFNF